MIVTAQQAAEIAAGWAPRIPTLLYLATKSYVVGEVVAHSGNLWICVNTEGCLNSAPAALNTDWEVIVTGV